jgi:hypothetical protein
MSSNQKLDQAKKQKNYSSLIGLLCSKTFRGPIKRFIDENCQSFEDKTENSHLQFQIHKQFADLVDSLLSHIKDELKISDNEFVELAKIGFERPEDRPYFEQVVVCDNYEWFKNCMVKRNITLKEQSYKLMYVNQGDLQFTKDSTINQMMIEKEKIELECALQMSLAAEEEKHKLYTGEQNIEVSLH